jgi:hypothetical protein
VARLIPPTQKAVRVLTQEELDGNHIHIEKKDKHIFPPPGIEFNLVLDGKTIRTNCRWVNRVQNKIAIQRNLGKWFSAHRELKAGTKLEIEVIEPMKRYRLKIA